ncbi:4947_t:CDS:2, partial [Funneliformis geosporum]
ENKLKDKKLKSLSRELETCYKTLSHQGSAILAYEDEIASLNSPMVLLELLRDIAIAIDRVKLYVNGDRSFDPKIS